MYLFIILIFCQMIYILLYFSDFFKKHFLTWELDLQKRYGEKTWVLITGCSSGQGRLYALEFAKRGFSILLVGRPGISTTADQIKEKYPSVETRCVAVDFAHAHKKHFFRKIERAIDALPTDLSILVNNVGHRVAWKPYHEMPEQLINDSIVCGTIVQARLTQIALRRFVRRGPLYKSAIVNITSINTYSNLWFGKNSDVTVPYMSVYEGANAFGYYHSNSIQAEYGKKIDVLNITPGAVLTENTSYLAKVPFAVGMEEYTAGMFKFLGNYNGVQLPYWGHDLSRILGNFVIVEKHIYKYVGTMICENFMNAYEAKKSATNPDNNIEIK